MLQSRSAKNGRELEAPDKLTAGWLIKHMPLSWWALLAGGALTLLGAGVRFGQLEPVKQLFGFTDKSQPVLTQEAKQQIDAVTQGHNKTVEQLTAGIIEAERTASSNSVLYSSAASMEVANRLKDMLEKENADYLRRIEAIRGSSKQED